MNGEAQSLLLFTREMGLGLPEEVQKRIGRNPSRKSGAEHKVFFDAHIDRERVIKVTFPGKYGRWEHTPFLYMERWQLLEEMVPEIKVRMEGCIETVNGELSIITSMQFFEGQSPTGEEADAFVKSLGFEMLHDGTTTLDYIKRSEKLILRDCHPGNWIKTKGALVPIDIIPERS